MTPTPEILLAKFITWRHLAERPLDYILTDEKMPPSAQSELIQDNFKSVCQEVSASGFRLDSEEFKASCADFEEEHGLENILFFILSDFEKDNPHLPDFGII